MRLYTTCAFSEKKKNTVVLFWSAYSQSELGPDCEVIIKELVPYGKFFCTMRAYWSPVCLPDRDTFYKNDLSLM